MRPCFTRRGRATFLFVFGMGFGEMVMIGIVLLLVVGPRELPRLLRAVGQGVRKLRTLSTDLRSQSGIDEIIRDEGLREDLDAIRSLSRGRVVDSLVRDAMRPARRPTLPRQPQVIPTDELAIPEGTPPTTEDERPAIGPDAYGALADDAKIPPKAELPPAEAIPPLGSAQDEVAVPAGSAPAAEEPG